MNQTLLSVMLFLIAFGLTWLIQRVFKLQLTTTQFGVMTCLMMLLLIPVWVFCPLVLHLYGPR